MIKADKTVLIEVDLGYAKMYDVLSVLGSLHSKAGFLPEAGDSIIMRATANEYGAPGTPARPFMRRTFDNRVDHYGRGLMDGLNKFLSSKDPDRIDVTIAFDEVAETAAEDIRDAISTWKEPPNSPATIARKGKNTPLVDTGEMRDAVDWDSVPMSQKPFKAADDPLAGLMSVATRTKGKRGKRRKPSVRRALAGFSSLAVSPGYEGKGIRKRAERRSGRGGVAEGVVSRRVRRKGLGSAVSRGRRPVEY